MKLKDKNQQTRKRIEEVGYKERPLPFHGWVMEIILGVSYD